MISPQLPAKAQTEREETRSSSKNRKGRPFKVCGGAVGREALGAKRKKDDLEE